MDHNLMKIKDAVRGYMRPLFREEATSVWKLLVCKSFMALKSAVHWLAYRKLRAVGRRKINRLKNRRSESVFVFANGPSINDLDFCKIKKLIEAGDFDFIAVNSFASKGMAQYGIAPTAIVCADPFHYVGSDGRELSEQAKEDIMMVNQMGVPALVPHRYYSKSHFNESIPFWGIYNRYGRNVSDLFKPLGYMSITAFVAISAAIHMGYKNIYICGYDNSYFKTFEVDQKNIKAFHDTHFYDSEKFTKRILPVDHYGNTSQVMLDIARHFSYLERIAKHKPGNVSIKNIALTTYTDVFERDFSLDVYKDEIQSDSEAIPP